MRTDEAFRKEVSEIGVACFHNVARDAVRRGAVCLTDKSPREGILALCTYVRQWLESDIAFVDDHRPEILEEARRAFSEERRMIGVILYATYFEHALNDVVLAGCARSKLEQPITLRLLRMSSVFDKTGGLLTDIGLPPLPDGVAKIIREVADLRNEYAHYKWTGRDEAQGAAHEARVLAALKSAEVAVVALDDYEKHTLLAGFDDVFGANKA